MPEGDSKEPKRLRGVGETYEGVRDFDDFDSYLNGWIRPNILEDLDTIFEGAKVEWDRKVVETPGRKDGRGDFLLAVSLLTVLDHFGGFLASPAEWVTSTENIARVLWYLPSTFDVYAIVANLGRNALVHGAWPQTSFPMDSPQAGQRELAKWAFGLSFNSNKDPERHDTFHIKFPKERPLTEGDRRRTLKLVLNVRNLKFEMLDVMERGILFRQVDQDKFARIKRGAILMGDPDRVTRERLDDEFKPGWQTPEHVRARRPRLLRRAVFETQIHRLLPEAKRLRIWYTKDPDEKVKRDHNGVRPPES